MCIHNNIDKSWPSLGYNKNCTARSRPTFSMFLVVDMDYLLTKASRKANQSSLKAHFQRCKQNDAKCAFIESERISMTFDFISIKFIVHNCSCV